MKQQLTYNESTEP